jgi:hypothetical protein
MTHHFVFQLAIIGGLRSFLPGGRRHSCGAAAAGDCSAADRAARSRRWRGAARRGCAPDSVQRFVTSVRLPACLPACMPGSSPFLGPGGESDCGTALSPGLCHDVCPSVFLPGSMLNNVPPPWMDRLWMDRSLSIYVPCSSVRLFIRPSVHPSVCVSVHPSFSPPVSLSVHRPPVHGSVCLSVHLSVCLSACVGLHVLSVVAPGSATRHGYGNPDPKGPSESQRHVWGACTGGRARFRNVGAYVGKEP